MRRVEKQLRQLIREELDVNNTRTSLHVCGHPDDHHLNEQLAQLASAYLGQYGGEADKQGLSGTERASYMVARGALGATQSGATQVAKQGMSFFTDTIRDTYENHFNEMVDWGITAASLAASLSLVGKPISVALDAGSASSNIYQYVKSNFTQHGFALGTVLDLCGIAADTIGDSARGLLKWLKAGGEIPDEISKWLAKSFIGVFGGKAAATLAWLGSPTAGTWLAQNVAKLVEVATKEGLQGSSAVTQKIIVDYVKGFMSERGLEAALNSTDIMTKINAGLSMAKITVDANVKKTIETGVSIFVKLANSIIADAFRLMINGAIKNAVASR